MYSWLYTLYYGLYVGPILIIVIIIFSNQLIADKNEEILYIACYFSWFELLDKVKEVTFIKLLGFCWNVFLGGKTKFSTINVIPSKESGYFQYFNFLVGNTYLYLFKSKNFSF